MFRFDLQRFAEDDTTTEQPETQAAPQEQEVSPEAGAGVQPQAGPDTQVGGGAQTDQTQQATFTQDDVNRIIEARLARERRQWEQRLQEVQTRIQPQPQATVNPQEQNRQFLAEFSRDPMGTLQKFAQRITQQQTMQQQQQVERAQSAARDAILEMQGRYPDFQQHSAAVMQHIQSDPFLSSVAQMAAKNPSSELYAGVLDRAYQAVKGRVQQAAQAAAGVQFSREQQALSGAKAAAAAPTQKAALQPSQKSAEDILFEAMQSAG